MAKEREGFIEGTMETIKFSSRRKPFHDGLEKIKAMNYPVDDYIHHFTCFTGHMTLARVFALQDLYRQTLGVAGHIADVGVYKGASFFLLAKLVKIFEPESLTQVHGFDWFKGNAPDASEPSLVAGAYAESFDRVKGLLDAQGLEDTGLLHNIDLTRELPAFFQRHPHLRFKFVFLDAGMYEVVRSSLPHFWERLSKGGVLVLDQYNHEASPGETRAVDEFFAGTDVSIRTLPYAWMPTAYIVK